MEFDIDVSFISVRIKKSLIVKDVSFKLKRGKINSIVGISGSGKSTLVRCITGQIEPYTGFGKVLGYDIKTEKEKIRHSIGYVPQNDESNLYLNLSAIDNIKTFGAMYNSKFLYSKEGEKEINQILDILDINTETRHLPCGLLSGGERKRVSIAVGIIHKPQLLFLDEPTTGLDELLKDQTFNYLKRINMPIEKGGLGITMCIVSHDLLISELVDHLIVIKEGEAIEQGDPRELIRELPSQGLLVKIKFQSSPFIYEQIKRFRRHFNRLFKEEGSIIEKVINIGRGEYIFFIDQMPWILTAFLRKLYEMNLYWKTVVLEDATLLDYFRFQS